MHVQLGPRGGGGFSGIEHGTYTWNPTNGSFTSLTGLDTNGEWGLSNAQPVGPCSTSSRCVLTASNGVLQMVTPNGNPPESTAFAIQGWFAENTLYAGGLILSAPNGAQVALQSIPEPAAILLAGVGLFGLALTRRRRPAQ